MTGSRRRLTGIPGAGGIPGPAGVHLRRAIQTVTDPRNYHEDHFDFDRDQRLCLKVPTVQDKVVAPKGMLKYDGDELVSRPELRFEQARQRAASTDPVEVDDDGFTFKILPARDALSIAVTPGTTTLTNTQTALVSLVEVLEQFIEDHRKAGWMKRSNNG